MRTTRIAIAMTALLFLVNGCSESSETEKDNGASCQSESETPDAGLDAKDVIADILQATHLHLDSDAPDGDKRLRLDGVFSDDEGSMLWVVLSDSEVLSQTFQIQEIAVQNKTVR